MFRKVALLALGFLLAVAADFGAAAALRVIGADTASAHRAGETAFILIWALALVLIMRHVRNRPTRPQSAAE
jgi:hypothetical protein